MGVDFAEKKARIMVYTRETTAEEYPDGLARSIHLAYSLDGKNYEAMNGNYGILFAKAVLSEEDTICPKGVRDPRVLSLQLGGFVIAAVRVNEDGSADGESEGKLLYWTTADFKEFKELGLLDCGQAELSGLPCVASLREASADSLTAFDGKLPEGAVAGNAVEVSRSLCDRAALCWSRLTSVGVRVPERIMARNAGDVEAVRAAVMYSDGSSALKQVKWETGGIDFNRPGTYRIGGTVINEQYTFPLACGYGDPVIFPWEGRYYFIATDDNRNDVGFYVRESEDVAGLFKEDTKQHLILALDEERGFVQTFWAPEFHVIGGELYILFAVSGTKWGPQCHLMKLKKGGSLTDPESWEDPVRIRRMDGRPLTEDGITLDMTYLKTGKRSYYIWSYRRNIGTALDTGSMLYIAAVDEAAPWQLASEPVLLSRPLYGWENVNHTINNEGPYAFTANDKIYLTYSGGAADGYTYALGLLTAPAGADLLDTGVWNKAGTPVLSYYSVEGEYGPGHNSFFTDAQGNLMIAYHAEDALDHHIRCDGIRRVHFTIQGEPVFDMSAQRDLDPALAGVEMEVVVG
ncbi:family 43 glycosylhydrolase [Eisenbergiella sp.]|uniref:family 43 glycosylhydrolase n=1 Tax=Eisenbergiella sp. TaxID=1924109 RepID=UPI0020852ADD|nr:family 43 glycosylhydrolase [Eisenbergiella sp.]BDF46844.1 alpha-arabinofuranosidase [Lachnospiraceae bacterium]GKH42917.1 alpha-arabinofuranosidase [Lachnospiraceae bacterium]